MENKKRSFFEKITGSIRIKEDEIEEEEVEKETKRKNHIKKEKNIEKNDWMEEESDEAELTVDVFQDEDYIYIQAFVAGVKPEDLSLTIGRDVVTIKGKRENSHEEDEENYFAKELYWGKFGRTILLPKEVEPDESEATEKHGLLTIKLTKVDKEKKNTIKVKAV